MKLRRRLVECQKQNQFKKYMKTNCKLGAIILNKFLKSYKGWKIDAF